MKRRGLVAAILLLGLGSARGELIEVTATGVGADAAGAEKAALVSAVKQAVGTSLDTETVVENEKVLYDRVLTLSDGFVAEYDVVGDPRERFDGLYETTIEAKVKKGEVSEALESAGLASARVDGRGLWAQSVTKLTGAKEAYAALEEKLPELVTRMVDVKILNGDGTAPGSAFAKPETVENLTSGTVSCTWRLRISTDREWWYEEAAPFLEAAFRRLGSGENSQRVSVKSDDNGNRQIIGEFNDEWREHILLETASDRMRVGRTIRIFEFPEQTDEALERLPLLAGDFRVVTEFSILGEGGEVLLRDEIPFPTGIVYRNYYGYGNFERGTPPREALVFFNRSFSPEFLVDGGSGVDAFPLDITVEVTPSLLREAKKLEAQVKTIAD